MKILSLLLIVVSFLSCEGKVASQKAKAIILIFDSGDRESNFIIGANEKEIRDSYQNDKHIKESIEVYYGAEKFIISHKAVNYISSYIESNCSNGSRQDEVSSVMTKIIFEEGKRECTIYRNKDIIEYLNGIIKWIAKSPYKNECKSLLDRLTFLVNNRKND